MKIKQRILKLEEVTRNNIIYTKNSINIKDIVGKPVTIFGSNDTVGLVNKCWVDGNEVWVECSIESATEGLDILLPSVECDSLEENEDGIVTPKNIKFLYVSISQIWNILKM